MAWCLTPPLTENDHRQMTMIHRFDPRFWTVDFPRPMLGCVVTTAPDALRADIAGNGAAPLGDQRVDLCRSPVDRDRHVTIEARVGEVEQRLDALPAGARIERDIAGDPAT